MTFDSATSPLSPSSGLAIKCIQNAKTTDKNWAKYWNHLTKLSLFFREFAVIKDCILRGEGGENVNDIVEAFAVRFYIYFNCIVV